MQTKYSGTICFYYMQYSAADLAFSVELVASNAQAHAIRGLEGTVKTNA
jgi:hypothetical protein